MGCTYNRNKGKRTKPNWWISWTNRAGRREQLGVGPDRDLAKAVLKKKEHDVIIAKNGLPPELPPIPTLEEAAKLFLERRSAVDADGNAMRRSWKDDRGRLNHHILPRLGKLSLDEITDSHMRKLIDALRAKIKPQTIRNCLNILSRIYNEQPRAMRLENPVGLLDRADRKAIGPAWDPKLSPWLKTEQVRAVYLSFPELAWERAGETTVRLEPWRAMFAVGTFAGLRPGEVIGLQWEDIDFRAKQIHVRRSIAGPLKDDDSRIAPISDTLAEVLRSWEKLSPLGSVQVFPHTGRRGLFVKEHTLGIKLREALEAAKVQRMTWYNATRHSFASRYVSGGGSLMKLSQILGHSVAETTLRYAHLQPGNFSTEERALVDVDLEPGKVLALHRTPA